MNAEGKDVISLAIGSPDMPPSPQTIETLCEEARHADAHGYQPTTGIPELRRAMADFYKRWYDGIWTRPAKYSRLSAPRKAYPRHVGPGQSGRPRVGAQSGIPHLHVAQQNLGQQITYYDLQPENGWQPDFKALEEMDLKGVKILWTNYPNMPTGANARRETYENW